MMRNNHTASSSPSRPSSDAGRRSFLKLVGGASAAALISATGRPATGGAGLALAAPAGAVNPPQRSSLAYQVRHQAALYEKGLPLPAHPTNGDEQAYPNYIGSYSKALPHNSLGEVDAAAFGALLRALASGEPSDFEGVPLGGAVKLVNPQSAYAFDLVGADSHQMGTAAPPSFNSAQLAGEAAELYWHALTRDVPFSEYETHPLTNAAAAGLSRLADFRGPKAGRQVTPATLFRGETADDLAGPYVSQFLWRRVPYGATPITQRIRTTLPGADYMTAYGDWLAVQNGRAAGPEQFDTTSRYIRNGRDLTAFVHLDFTYQAFLNACLILLGARAPFDAANPYNSSRNQAGFNSFGAPHVLDLVARAANCGLNAAWYQKWSVHRRLRPEEFGGAVHNRRAGAADYPIHTDILNSRALDEVFSRAGTYLLPQAYPEGCPTHPAYPAGHAVIAGACATMLKAFFDESFVIPEPVEASADGLSLNPYAGAALTAGGELNKLAANIAIARNFAGVHWRSDGIEGLKLGEAVAVSLLTDAKACFSEHFDGFQLTRFDGTTVTI